MKEAEGINRFDPATPKKLWLIPVGDRLIVDEDDFSYHGKLTIPDSAKRRTTTGHVAAIDPDVTLFKVGDRILYTAFAGTDVQLKGKPAYRIMTSDEVLAILTTDDVLDLDTN